MIRALRQLRVMPAVRFVSEAYTQLAEGTGMSRRLYIIHNNKRISPWHDIYPFTDRADELIMVNEIPR